MGGGRYCLYQISVGGGGHTKAQPNCYIPRLVKPLTSWGEQIPESGSIEASSKDINEFHFHFWINKAELLEQRVYFANKHPSFECIVSGHGVVALQKIT